MMRLARVTLVGLVSAGSAAACNSEQSGLVPSASGGTFAQAPNGGNMASGGTTTPNAGGAATGGTTTPNAGGAATGGTTTGGAATGGTTTGGTATGGKSIGGNATGGRTPGGANTGGVGTGGVGTGGAMSNPPIGGTHSGEATFYTPNGNGNCSFGSAVSGMDIAALNQPDYSMAAWCGACAEVTGPLGTVRVLIQDRCPECQSGDLDLNPEAFDKIALHSAGRVAITWKFVACNVTGPVRYHFKEGSNTGWTAIQVLNHRLPITTLEYSIDGGTTYKPTVRQEYNYFLEANGFGPNVTFVRLTAATGQTLIDILPFPSSDATIDGQANF